jgi:PAS domain S-box-containing protein
MRPSGIDILDDIPSNSHICLFYETAEDLVDILVPYFKAGLENNEFCMWVTSEPLSQKKAENALKKALPDLEHYYQTGQIEIIPHSQWYLHNGKFSLEQIFSRGRYKLDQALKAGFAGIRSAGNSAWLKKADWERLSDYELQANMAISENNVMAICAYWLDKCTASDIVDVVSNHECALIRRKGKWVPIESSERKKSEEKLRKYKFMVESAHDAIFFKDLESRYIIANNKTAEAFGLSPEQVIGKGNDYELMTTKEEAKSNIEDDQVVFKTGKPREITKKMTCADGKVRWFQAIKVPQFNEKGDTIGLVGIARDITDQKNAEESLHKSEEKYRSLVTNIPDVTWTVDNKYKTVFITPNVENLFGYTPEEIYKEDGSLWFGRVHPDDVKKVKKAYQGLFNIGAQFNLEYRIKKKNGKWIWLLGRSIATYKKDGIKYADGIFSDITERKRAENKIFKYQEHLRSLASELILSEDRQCRQIASDLHDHVIQRLILFKINLGSLREKELPAELIKPLDQIYEDINQIIEDTRSLTFDLGSPTLYELGLEAAIREWLTEEVQQKYGINTEFENRAQPYCLDEDVCTLLYRSVKELLVNVIKHSKARHVKVSISNEKNNICIEVIDDGTGFASLDNLTSDHQGGFGLFSTRERLSYLGGRLEIDSKLNEGTRVTLIAPIKPKKK